jgi:methionyl-tRNA formyltransferase
MRLIFMGTPQAAVPTLRRCLEDGHEVVAVWTQPDRPLGRGNRVTRSPVKEFALTHRLAVHQPANIKTAEAKALFTAHEAEVAVIVAYGQILPDELLRAPRLSCINVHFSLLPHYRGAAPVNWAIVNGESKTGVTTMLVEKELDCGPILLQRETMISADETATELIRRLAVIGAEVLGETLTQVRRLTPHPQHNQNATFAPLLKKEDGLIKWSDSAFVIERCIRGFQPWPNAYTYYRSRRLIIWCAAAGIRNQNKAVDSGIISVSSGDLVVQCGGQTELRLIEVQPEGKTRMSARDFLNGMHSQVGERLG